MIITISAIKEYHKGVVLACTITIIREIVTTT